TCAAVCGDGIKDPTEECDDGNTTAGDGCSPTCTIEPGFACTVQSPTPDTRVLPILYRDMLYAGTVSPGPGHPDFESTISTVTTGLVQSQLGADRKPVWQSNIGSGAQASLSGAVNFCWWYHDTGCAGVGTTNPFAQLVSRDATNQPTTLTLNNLS